MSRRRISRSCVLLAAAGLCAASATAAPPPPLAFAAAAHAVAPEPPPFTLIGPDLSARPVRIAGWSAAGLTVADETGLERELPRSRAAALAPISWSITDSKWAAVAPMPQANFMARRPAGVVELTDGQRFVGSPVAEDAGAEHLVWDHPQLGRLRLPLERIRRIDTGLSPRASAPAARAGDDDEVHLVNGDRVAGLIESIGESVVVSLGTGRSAGRVEIPLDRVGSITLVNPPVEPSGTMVWLKDGSVIRAASLEAQSGSQGMGGAGGGGGAPTLVAVGLEEDLGSERRNWPLDQIAAVNFDAAALRPLASLPIAAQGRAPGSTRRRIESVRVLPPEPADATATAPLGAADIEFPGPMMVDWTLPQGATRLAGWAELPEAFRAWGDCEVTIGIVGPGGGEAREVWRRRINADAPVARFDVPLSPGTVRFTIEPGERGPVQDRIVVRRALLAITR